MIVIQILVEVGQTSTTYTKLLCFELSPPQEVQRSREGFYDLELISAHPGGGPGRDLRILPAAASDLIQAKYQEQLRCKFLDT